MVVSVPDWLIGKRDTPPAGFEPATCALGKRCSIQLSYGSMTDTRRSGPSLPYPNGTRQEGCGFARRGGMIAREILAARKGSEKPRLAWRRIES